MNRVLSFLGMVCLACALGSRAAAAEGTDVTTRTVRSSEVTALAIEHNQSLQAALSVEDRAQATVQAQEGIYPYVFDADTGYTHASTPLGSSQYRSSDEVSVGAGVSKAFSVGTAADVHLTGQWYQVENPTAETSGGSNFGLGARFSLSQPLLRGFGREVGLSSLRQAQKDKTAAEKSADRAASALVRNVLDTYWDLWMAAKTVEINAKSRDVAEEQLKETAERVTLGAAAPVEKLSYQTRLASLAETVVESEAEVRRLQILLAAETGLIDRYHQLLPDTSESPPVEEDNRLLSEILKQSLTESPSIQEAFAAVSAAEEKVRVAGESMRQRLDLSGWIEARTLGEDRLSPVVTDLSKGGAYAGYVGLTYELPLDNRKKEGERAQARLGVEIATLQLRDTENQVRADTAAAFDALQTARTRLQMAAETLALAGAQAEAERERYRLGAAIFTSVRDAEETVREAELRLTRARVDIVKTQIELDHLTGRLLKQLTLR